MSILRSGKKFQVGFTASWLTLVQLMPETVDAKAVQSAISECAMVHFLNTSRKKYPNGVYDYCNGTNYSSRMRNAKRVLAKREELKE
jgi:hypothetical protein